MPTRRKREARSPTLDECLALTCDERECSPLLSPAERERLGLTFGSVEDARDAWRVWRDRPELGSSPGIRATAWWAFEEDVPADLRSTAAFMAAHPEVAVEAEAIALEHHIGHRPEYGWTLLVDEAQRAFLDERGGETHG